MSDPYLYRLATLEDWQRAQEAGEIIKTEIDRRDGFIHLSTAGQLILTANLHFSDHEKLVALLFVAEELAEKLKWESVASRHDELPHYYGDLAVAQVAKVMELERGPGGSFGAVTRGAV